MALISTLSLWGNNTLAQKINVGDKAPQFSLYDQDGNLFNSSDFLGKNVMVVFFYPKDGSGICTKEACSFKDNFAEFTSHGAVVVGINSADAQSHKKFKEQNRLPFNLLCDPKNKVLRLFGVKNKFIFTGRETFVIDLSGKIAFQFNSFTQGEAHVTQVINYLKTPLK